ncbi:MAG: hypothetical protein QOJ52_4124 [Acidimicrobiaceae bacterium]|jgi:hypothetical protein|nr:hypothetical protein [Acidimicrobiaceae bacterium]
MNNRCRTCGFLNFASSSACKRCKAAFDEAPLTEPVNQSDHYSMAWQGSYQMAAQWPQPMYQPSYFPMPVAMLPAKPKYSGTNALLVMMLVGVVAIAGGISFLWKFNKAASDNYAWQEYQAPDNSFAVSMPTKPEETSRMQSTPRGTLQMHFLTGDMKQDGFYGIAYADYPADSAKVPASALLDVAANGAASNSGAQIESKKSISLSGYEGLEIDMSVPPATVPGGGRVACRILWVAPRIYIACVGGPESSSVYKRRAKFLDSFRLKK